MLSGIPYSIDEDREPVAVPIWQESLAGLDLLFLRASPIYLGFGIPRGNGSAVVMIPGFMGSDLYLGEMYFWLRRIGYKPYVSGISLNAECPKLLVEQKVFKTLDRALAETGRPVHLVGHSLGGMMARSIAVQRPADIASVVSLGSPFRAPMHAHAFVLQTADSVREKIRREHGTQVKGDCFTGYCDCVFGQGLRGAIPRHIQQTAIYTKSDGIVEWEACVTGNPEWDFEVKGTHVGLAFNALVYALIAKRLARRT